MAIKEKNKKFAIYSFPWVCLQFGLNQSEILQLICGVYSNINLAVLCEGIFGLPCAISLPRKP
jgi:hypothetical protein